MKRISLIIILLILLGNLRANTESSCTMRNTAFKSGERLTFHVYYTLAGIWVHAGNVTFTTNLETLNGKPVYHIIGDGATLPGYDWIYRVRDRYETYIDTNSLTPFRFIRNVDEGGYRKYENVTFYPETNTAVTNKGVFKVPNCVQDVLSEVYLARNIDFNKYKPGDQIPFDLFLDNKVYSMYIRYLGKETIKSRYGKFRCIKFKPLLLKGTIFEGGEKMTVWVTDDANHLPVRVESPISVGSVKVDMMEYRNIRHPLTSLIGIR
jgi:Protein of unknown function (DUF3108)